MKRRTLLELTGIGLLCLPGCSTAPSSSPPPYETREIDGGAVFEPGLRDERPVAFFAALVASEDEARGFAVDALARGSDRQFIAQTDYQRSYLGVVQVSGLTSSMELWLVDIAVSDVNLGLVIDVRDQTPYTDDRVITTFLVRVQRERRSTPDGIWVQLSMGDRIETFAGT